VLNNLKTRDSGQIGMTGLDYGQLLSSLEIYLMA